MIEIYLLEQLDAFATYGTLSEAADKLHMTQPTLTRSMQKLEDYFGFQLFERNKKRITLNDTGKLMAQYARKILEEEQNMELQVRNFHKSLNSLNIGSVAPGPLMVLLPRSTSLYPNTTIASTVDKEEAIIHGLLIDEYNLIVTTHPIESSEIISKEYISESLNVSVSPMHPAAASKSVSFAEMDGQNFIMYSQVGIWESIVTTHMPHSSFFKQESMQALEELRKYSELPSFTTNITNMTAPVRPQASNATLRVNVPISDDAATITFYLSCKKSKFGDVAHCFGERPY